ncbi:hypothetical protein BRYFOR_05643 [Marvinbryantia formatexigens DSM 14469]|uniref:Uncharacterized protein n=1 Tax=Marvinbryantia formatexigens DSM 14469 TaxID=478749 RepID=C6LAK2_9FIRM|nr:hypothetical protein BRYFOR_05643 [Marvinbryantia formatexigens DSM 14469]
MHTHPPSFPVPQRLSKAAFFVFLSMHGILSVYSRKAGSFLYSRGQ